MAKKNNNTESFEEQEFNVENQNNEPIREILANEFIPVTSVTEGGVTYKDKRTNLKYTWSHFGATQLIPFEVILSMYASSPTFLTEPLLIIKDNAVVKKLYLDEVYKNFPFHIANDLDGFFKLPIDKMKEEIEQLSDSVKENLKVKARILYENKELSDLNKIDMLERVLNIDLKILSDDFR